MKSISGIFLGLICKKNDHSINEKSNYIYYKIVDFIKNEKYALQCINTSAIFYASISEIVLDTDILYALHPIQACYIGIEYARHIKKHNFQKTVQKNKNYKINSYPGCRYGKYNLYSQDRQGNLCFINITTHHEVIMDARDIALSEELISEFDASQAFYIGLQAGLKINNPIKKENRPFLQIIK